MVWNKEKKSLVIVFILITICSFCQNLNFYGINIELPIMVGVLPEGWRLPAIYNLISQTAIVSISIILIISHLTKSSAYEGITIIIILIISTIPFIFLGLTWNKTTLINNQYCSTYFFIFTFIVYVCDYTGTLLFLPYLNRYKPIMMRAYFLGDAISSGSLALLGFIQDAQDSNCISVIVENNTKLIEHRSSSNFSVRTYFFILSIIMFSSLLSFIILFLTRIGQNENNENMKLIDIIQIQQLENNEIQMNKKQFWLSHHGLYLLAMFWTCFITYGFLLGLQTYSLNSYSTEIYQKTIVSVEITYILIQIICVTYSNITILSYPRLVHILNIIATILFIYIFIVAKMSPCPPLIHNSLIGGIISSSVWIIINCINNFVFVLLNIYFREVSGQKGLFWSCVMIQCGTFSGAFINYLLTVHFDFFKERFLCVDYICS